MIQVAVSYFSRVGPRSDNQDCLLVPHKSGEFLVAAVADGIGGAVGGELAAHIAIDVASRAGPDPARLPGMLSEVVCRIVEEARQAGFEEMGTTLSVALLVNKMAHIVHVGDTRIYHLRGTGLNTLTEDQTEVAALYRKGVLTKIQARRYRRRNVLISALTSKNDFVAYSSSGRLDLGDRLLLTTDGVHSKVDKRTIARLSSENANVSDFIATLELEVEKASPTDNYTAMAIQMDDIG